MPINYNLSQSRRNWVDIQAQYILTPKPHEILIIIRDQGSMFGLIN